MPESSASKTDAETTPAPRGRAAPPDYDESKFRLGPALRGDASREGFDAGGDSVDPDDIRAVAKRVSDAGSGNVRCFVRAAKKGGTPGRFFAPHDPFQSRKPDQTPYHWCPVTAEKFDAYLLYLRTKNPAHLRFAERVD